MKWILLCIVYLTTANLLSAQKDSVNAGYEKEMLYPSALPATKTTAAVTVPLAALHEALPTDGTLIVQAHNINIVEETITIPVVVHVLYNAAQQNISDEQIFSQIAALNKDYRGTNADRSKVPAYFAAFAADCNIAFKLADTNPDGAPSTGIIRKHTSISQFSSDDRIKSASGGGDNGWDRRYYLNIWVGNLAGGMLGYASLPGADADKDGVVIQYTAFGTMGTVSAPFNLGRTATHEIGHWLNLKHLWGDAYCGDDEVDDTPTQRASNRGTPTGEKFTCGTTGHGDMYMNFMDLTDDAAMFMFTEGQKRRMRSLFQNYGVRHEMITSDTSPKITLPLLFALPVQTEEIINNYALYPNPAVSNLSIEDKNNRTVTDQPITIYNSAGQPVMMQNMNGMRISINVSRLKPGLYFIKMGREKKEPVMKFVKE